MDTTVIFDEETDQYMYYIEDELMGFEKTHEAAETAVKNLVKNFKDTFVETD